MKKLLSIAAAVSLTVAMTACSKDTEVPSTPTAAITTATQPATAMVEPPSDRPSDDMAQAPTGTSSGAASSSPTGAPAHVDQSTPEAAVTSWLDAMLSGDSTSVCALMATKGQALKDVPKAVETCKTMVDPMLKTLEPVKDMLKNLDVKGATVNGDRASFENATTTPAMAAQLIKPFKAVKVKGKWYITE